MENSFFKDLLMLIGILPIERPFNKVRPACRGKNFLRVLSDEERKENKLNTEKLFNLIG